MAWKMEVQTGTDPTWYPNGVTWPDKASALAEGKDLSGRWLLVTDYRAVESDEQPNRPTWDGWIAERGLPPRSVTL